MPIPHQRHLRLAPRYDVLNSSAGASAFLVKLLSLGAVSGRPFLSTMIVHPLKRRSMMAPLLFHFEASKNRWVRRHQNSRPMRYSPCVAVARRSPCCHGLRPTGRHRRLICCARPNSRGVIRVGVRNRLRTAIRIGTCRALVLHLCCTRRCSAGCAATFARVEVQSIALADLLVRDCTHHVFCLQPCADSAGPVRSMWTTRMPE